MEKPNRSLNHRVELNEFELKLDLGENGSWKYSTDNIATTQFIKID